MIRMEETQMGFDAPSLLPPTCKSQRRGEVEIGGDQGGEIRRRWYYYMEY